MFQGRPFGRLRGLNIDSPAACTAFVVNSRFFQLTFLLAARSNVVSRWKQAVVTNFLIVIFEVHRWGKFTGKSTFRPLFKHPPNILKCSQILPNNPEKTPPKHLKIHGKKHLQTTFQTHPNFLNTPKHPHTRFKN